MISKSDFTLYLESPMHLWAKKHGQLEEAEPNRYQKYLIDQGDKIENLANSYLQQYFTLPSGNVEIIFQTIFTYQSFTTRIDAAIFHLKEDVWDLYEIKSGTSVKKEYLYDLGFSYLVCQSNLLIRDSYLIHLNKDYEMVEGLEISKLFVINKTTPDIQNHLDEIRGMMESASRIALLQIPTEIEGCLNPKTCPCPHLCHPNLPEYSIYTIPRLGKKKIQILKNEGMLSITDLPENYSLSEIQGRQVKTVKTGEPWIDQNAIREMISSLLYPLYFLDYETCNPGVPLFPGFKPYQHIVFQYSLHVLGQDGEFDHSEYLGVEPGNPESALLTKLERQIGETGSVIVWNKSFEANRNKEMANRHIQFDHLLASINERMFDLMEVFRQGHFIHPDFRGSYSIKQILPVLFPENDLCYQDLLIPKGEDAMAIWQEIISGGLSQSEIEERKRGLLEYCRLDTLAMVEIWKVLKKIT